MRSLNSVALLVTVAAMVAACSGTEEPIAETQPPAADGSPADSSRPDARAPSEDVVSEPDARASPDDAVSEPDARAPREDAVSEAGDEANPLRDGGADGGRCNEIVNNAPRVEFVGVSTVAPPLSGGPIAFGTYQVVRVEVYQHPDGGMDPLGDTLEETIVVGPSTIQATFVRRAGDGGVRVDQRELYAYTSAGNVLKLTGACGAFRGTLDVPYASAVDGGPAQLQLLILDTLATFTKI